MKRKILGALIMIIGLAMTAVSTALMSAAFDAGGTDAIQSSAQSASPEGKYLSAAGKTSIVVFDDRTLQMSGGEVQEYELVIWKDIPKTDENTGKITLQNYYFLQLEQSRIAFIPENQTLELNGKTYAKA